MKTQDEIINRYRIQKAEVIVHQTAPTAFYAEINVRWHSRLVKSDNIAEVQGHATAIAARMSNQFGNEGA